MNVGFIGLGIMGKPMARNLLRAGYKVYAYDIVGSSVDCVAQDGLLHRGRGMLCLHYADYHAAQWARSAQRGDEPWRDL